MAFHVRRYIKLNFAIMNDFYTKEEINEKLVGLATKEDVSLLATKKDIEGLATKGQAKQILRVFNAVSSAARLTERGSILSFRFLVAFASLLVACGIIWGFFRGGLSTVAQIITDRI